MSFKSIPVFCYHDVGPEGGLSAERFREHLDAIEDAGYATATAADLAAFMRGEKKLDGRRVVLTFDDGHISSRTVIAPELAKRGMTGCFFVLPDFMDDAPARDERRMPQPKHMRQCFIDAHGSGDNSQFINTGETAEMLSMGMEIHSHGLRHQGTFRTLTQHRLMGNARAHWGAWSIYPGFDPNWPVFDVGSAYVHDGFWPTLREDGVPQFRLRAEQERRSFCLKDFRDSLERVRELNGLDEQLFCWPWGDFDDLSMNALKEAGYAGSFTLERGPNVRGGDPYRMHRVGVGKNKTGKWVQQRLRMYSNRVSATVCFKRFTKKHAPKCVLYATDSSKLSGGSRQMVNNAEAMRDLGLRTLALLKPGSPLKAEMEKAGAKVVEYDGFDKPLAGASYLKTLVGEHNVDVVHTFHNRAYKLGSLARLMGCKFKLFINRGVISRPNDVFFLWTAPADAVVCNSVMCADVLRRKRIPEKRLAVVYNAYNGPDLGGVRERKKRGVRLLYIGNAAVVKGFDVFLRAMEEFCKQDARDVEFVAVGVRDAEMKRFDGVVSAATLDRLHLTGVLEHAQTLEQVRASDLLVVPSRKESLPNTLLEAFDAGLPAVVTRVGGMPELVRDGVNGFICEDEDAECIARRIRQLCEDRDLRTEMGRVNRRIVRTLMTRQAKGMNLVRVYMGQRPLSALNIEEVSDDG